MSHGWVKWKTVTSRYDPPIGCRHGISCAFLPGAIILMLEKRSAELAWDPTWVFVTLLEIGIPFPVLHGIYDRLFKAKVSKKTASCNVKCQPWVMSGLGRRGGGGVTLESVDEILKCDHSNESYWAVLSCGAFYYAIQDGSNFWAHGWNPKVWPFIWKLLSSTFLWCCLLCCTRWF